MKRSETLDIAKGIGILLVVWGHSHAPLSPYTYQFTVPFFFLISGYLYNRKDSLKTFVWKRTKSLYIPFITWNIAGGLVKWISGIEIYTIGSFAKYVIAVLLTLNKDGLLFGATWFLGSLFTVAILYKFMDTQVQDGKYKRLLLTVIFAAIAVLGFSETFRFMLSRTMILCLFYALGVFVREYKDIMAAADTPAIALFCMALFIAGARSNTSNMGANLYSHVGVFVIGALAASYALIFASRKLCETWAPVKNLLLTFGRRSIDILIWQFIAFRMVIAFQFALEGKPLDMLFKAHSTYHTGHGWWMVYVVVGLFVPMLIGWILRKGFWGKFLKKIHVV